MSHDHALDEVPTLEEVQESWRASRKSPEVQHPHCYNRASVVGILQHGIYPPHVPWRTQWMEGCPHWIKDGNATIRPYHDGPGGVRYAWSTCEGCSQKKMIQERGKSNG